MRIILAALILAVAIPQAYARGDKGQCKTRCDGNYKFCVKRSTTKQARKSCKLEHKTCRNTCR